MPPWRRWSPPADPAPTFRKVALNPHRYAGALTAADIGGGGPFEILTASKLGAFLLVQGR